MCIRDRLYAAPATGRLSDPKDVGPVDGYSYEPSLVAVKPPKPVTVEKTAETQASPGSSSPSKKEDARITTKGVEEEEDKNFIKNAWQSQLGSSEVSREKKESLGSALGSRVTEQSVSKDIYSAWKKQGFDDGKIDRV